MFRNIGICDAVEQLLREEGDMNYDQICFSLSETYTRGNVSGALSTLLRGSRILKYGPKRNAMYGIRHKTQESPSGLRKYVPEFKPLQKSGMTANWALCLRAPFDPKKSDE